MSKKGRHIHRAGEWGKKITDLIDLLKNLEGLGAVA